MAIPTTCNNTSTGKAQKTVVPEHPEYSQSVSSTQAESMLRIFGERASSLTLSETNGQMGGERASDLFLEKSTKISPSRDTMGPTQEGKMKAFRETRSESSKKKFH